MLILFLEASNEMHMPVAQWVLESVCIVLQLFLFGLMLVRKSRSEFPVFCNYIAFSALTQAFLLVAVTWSYAQYFYAYWTVTALSTLLGFAVLYESVTHVMKPYSALRDFAKMLFLWAGSFLFVISLLAAFATNGSCATKVCAAIFLINRCILLMQCGLLFLMLLFEKRLGASWMNRGMYLAAGLGGSAVLRLSLWYLLEHFLAWRTSLELTYDTLLNGVVVFWVVGFMLSERKIKTLQDAPKRLILQRWNDTLASHGFGPAPAMSFADSFIPGVEQTVERILARKMTE